MTPDAEALKLVFATNRNWSEWATIAVFVGLLGDILVIFLFSKDKPRSETWLAFICTLIIAVGVYGEYSFGSKAAQAANQLQQLSDQKVSDSNLKAEAAQAEVARLNLETAKLRDLLRWRELTKEQRDLIHKRISSFPGVSVQLEYVANDWEGFGYAEDFRETFEPGWTVVSPLGSGIPSPNTYSASPGTRTSAQFARLRFGLPSLGPRF
jgi:hypothetical protein